MTNSGQRHGRSDLKIWVIVSILSISVSGWGKTYFSPKGTAESKDIQPFMAKMRAMGKKARWNPVLYTEKGWHVYGKTKNGNPLIYYVCGEKNENTTLMLSTVHGDEVTPVYYGLRLISWLNGEPDLCRDYRVVVAPIINPDGYLAKKSTRTNANGVDLNRNFPTQDFDKLAHKLWKTRYKSNPRRYPGKSAGSEVETKFQMWLIDEFKPSKILTVHSPYNFFDYDGPENKDIAKITKEYIKSCQNLRSAVRKASKYKFLRYRVFPGSLGNYAGNEMGIPTLTLELPSEDASKARSYFERLKRGNRKLISYKLKGDIYKVPIRSLAQEKKK